MHYIRFYRVLKQDFEEKELKKFHRLSQYYEEFDDGEVSVDLFSVSLGTNFLIVLNFGFRLLISYV